MIKVLTLFSFLDDDYMKKAERLYAFPAMNSTDFNNAYGGSSYLPYIIMVKYHD